MTTYSDFLKQALSIRNDHVRTETEAYTEIVIHRDSLAAMLDVMNRFFGSAAKAEGQKPSPEQVHLTSRHGGIRADQILYIRTAAEDSAMAMFWPWSNGTLITVKIFRAAPPAGQTKTAKSTGVLGRIFDRFSPPDHNQKGV